MSANGPEHLAALADRAAPADGECGDQVLEEILVGDVDRLSISKRRPVNRPGERLVASRVVDHANDRTTLGRQRNGDAEERNAVGVV